MGMGPFARFLAMRAMQQAAPPAVPDYSGSLSGGVYGPTTGMPPAPPMAMAGPPGGIPPAIRQAMLAQAMVAAAQQAQGNPGAMARPRPYSRWGDTIGSVNSTASPVVPADPSAIQTSSPAAVPVTPEQAQQDARRAALMAAMNATPGQMAAAQQNPPAPVVAPPDAMAVLQGRGAPALGEDPTRAYLQWQRTRDAQKQAAYRQTAADNPSPIWQAVGGAVARGATTVDKILGWPVEKVYEAQADSLYQSIKYGREHGLSDREIITTYKNAANPLTWNVPIGPNDSDEEITAFFDGLIDAYEHGYTAYGAPEAGGQRAGGPTGTQQTVVAQWGPGAQAAHEYMAGQSNIAEKTAGAVLLDPTNYAVPAAGKAGEVVAKTGAELAAEGVIKTASEEGFKGAAKAAVGRTIQVAGQTMRVPDVVLNQAADKAIGGAIGVTDEMLRAAPIIGGPYGQAVDYLAETPTKLRARFAAEDARDKMIAADEWAGSASTDIGGTAPTPPGQTVVPPEPSAGPMGGAEASGPIAGDVLGGPGANQGYGVPNEQRIAGVQSGETNLFDPVSGGDRLVDQPANGARTGNDDLRIKADAFEAANKPKRDAAWERDREIESQIKQKQREAEALKQQRDQLKGPERKTAHDAAQTKYAEAESLKADQKINGVEHTVYDVARDYRDAFHDLPEIPVTAKRIEPPRAMGDDLEGLVGGDRTPNGNRVGSIQPPRDAQQAYTITGKGGEKTKIVKGADGKWTVTKGGEAAGAPDGFTTAKGSTYRVTERGTTVRDKSYHPEHGPTDVGIQPESQATFYVTGDDATKLAEIQTQGAGKRSIAVEGNRAGIRYDDGPSAGKIERRTVVPIKTKPEVGLTPVELWNDGSRVHFGNEITSVRRGNVLAEGVTKTEAIRVSDANLTPAELPHGAQQTPWLIERAVYADDQGALNILKERLTPEQYARVEQMRGDLPRIAAGEDVPPPRAEAVPSPETPIGAEPGPQAEAPPIGTGEPKVADLTGAPGNALPADIAQTLDYTPFAGNAEPIYKGWSLRRVRDSMEPAIAEDQATAIRLAQEIRDGKIALGLDPNNPLDVRVKKGVTRPVVEAETAGGKISTTDLIAKEKELTSLRVRYEKSGDILTETPRAIANDRAARALEADINPALGKRPNAAADFLDALLFRSQRHLALLFPSYTARNITGNILTSTIGTEGRNLDLIPEHFLTAVRKGPGFAEEFAADAGFKLPEQLRRDTVGGALDVMGRGSDTPTREIARKLKLDWIARGGDKVKAWNGGFEYAGKMDLGFIPIWRGIMTENMDALAEQTARYAERRGIALSKDEVRDLMFGLRKPETGIFSAADLDSALYDAAVARGVDETAARNLAKTASQEWKHGVWSARNEAITQTNRIFPGIRRMTNADRIASHVFFFHLWPTRQARFVLEEMIRHPQLYHAYREAHDGLGRMAEEGNYPSSVKMLMHIADSPFGFALFANPVSLFLVSYLQPDQPGRPDPDGMTKVGHYLKQFKEQTGLGFAPFIDALVNVGGIYGDSFPPAPWPTQTVDLAQAAVDYGLTKMGYHVTSPVWQNAMVQLREWGSGWIPGTSKIRASNQNGYTLDIIGSVVLDNNPELARRMAQVDAEGNPTPDALAARHEYDAIMGDEDNPEYVKAEKAAAGQNLFTRVVNAISPFSIRAKMLSREDTLDLAKAGRAAKDAGQEPTPMQKGAIAVRNAVTQTPEANELDAQLGEYRSLGTDRQRSLAEGWALIAYADGLPDGQYVKVGGRYYSKTELAAMDQDARYALADSWVAEVGGTAEYADYRSIRSAFLDDPKHAELKKYDAYKDAITKSPLGAEQWVALTRASNPNYDAYLTEQEQKYGQAALDAAFTPGAYLAWKGAKSSLYEANPESVRDTTKVPFDANETVGGTGASTATAKSDNSVAGRAARLDKSIAVYNAKVAALQPYLPQGTRWESMSPTMRSAYTDSLRRQGIGIPSMPATVASYQSWVATRAPGDDTSTIAYVRWADSMDAALGLPAGTTIPEEAMSAGAGQTLPTYGYADPIGSGGFKGYQSYGHSVG